MNKNNSIVAFYPSHTAAEAAVKELQNSGFDMKKLSIVGRDYHTDEQVVIRQTSVVRSRDRNLVIPVVPPQVHIPYPGSYLKELGQAVRDHGHQKTLPALSSSGRLIPIQGLGFFCFYARML